MALPTKRLSVSRTRSRAAHDSLKKKLLVACSSCNKKILPHHACAYCGSYKGKKVSGE